MDTIEKVIELLGSENSLKRKVGAMCASRISDALLVKPLIKVLGDEDYEACFLTAVALGKIGEPAVDP